VKNEAVTTIVLAVQMLTALGMIGLILLQHGKGADMGAAFGSGASGSLFGATGSANFLSRTTAVLAGVFFACTLLLAYFSHSRPPPTRGSVLERARRCPAPASARAPPARSRAAPPRAVQQGRRRPPRRGAGCRAALPAPADPDQISWQIALLRGSRASAFRSRIHGCPEARALPLTGSANPQAFPGTCTIAVVVKLVDTLS
jgi:preprotein translocase subunit SecG